MEIAGSVKTDGRTMPRGHCSVDTVTLKTGRVIRYNFWKMILTPVCAFNDTYVGFILSEWKEHDGSYRSKLIPKSEILEIEWNILTPGKRTPGKLY